MVFILLESHINNFNIESYVVIRCESRKALRKSLYRMHKRAVVNYIARNRAIAARRNKKRKQKGNRVRTSSSSLVLSHIEFTSEKRSFVTYNLGNY